MSEWDQTGAEAPEPPPPKTPGWDAGAPPDPAWGERTLRGLVAGMRVFGRFSLERMLGRGGMGVVWLALDQQLGLEVALKFLPDMVAHDRMALEDLREETLRSLRLTHPHIVRVYDFHQDGGCAAIAMEYVDGDTLSNLRLGRPGRVFTTGELLPWLQQACEALEYAHARAKVVHRDLKPANLMVNRAGEVRVTDFGIARSLAESMTRVSGRSGTSGTLVYMSPQQARGIPPSPADDIYSLGATIYDLLTGKPPFYSGNIQAQIDEVVPPPMAQRRAELGVVGEPIPAQWEAVVVACLNKDPTRRPGSAREVVARLSSTFNSQRLTTNVQGERGVVSGEQRATSAEHGKRNTGERAGALLALGLILAAVGAGGWWFGVEGSQREPVRAAEEQRLAAESARKAEEALTGTLEVHSEPPGAAVIWADGRRLGMTPLRLVKVPAGEVAVRLELEGYEPSVARGTVVVGRDTALVGALRALAPPFAGTRAGQEMENSIGMRLCWCPAGEFVMGSPDDEDGRDNDETQHRARLTQGFWLGKTEVTQAEWHRVVGSNPSEFTVVGSRAPVEMVSWEEAVVFCAKLTEMERRAGRLPEEWEYRLPTEAQWEYACRAGTMGAYAGDLDRMGWHETNSGSTTHSAGGKAANAWGLYDMHGNVWEWCADWHGDYSLGSAIDPTGPTSGSFRVFRGGGWNNATRLCRAANRSTGAPGNRDGDLGFRVAAVRR